MASTIFPKWISSSPQKTWKESPLSYTPKEGKADLVLEVSRYQKWKGFGACFNELGWIALQPLGKAKTQEILRRLFSPGGECDFNFCRLPIGANDYAEKWYSHDETQEDYALKRFSIGRDRKYLIPYLKAALKLRPDMALFASPWSPPTWMKTPSQYKGGQLRWEERVLKAYAAYFRKFVEAYRKEGIRLRQVHVQNEPDSNQVFPSCLWSGERLRDFIRDYLGPEFKSHRVDCEIWLGTMERADYGKWIGPVLEDPKARGYLSGVGFQWQGKGVIGRVHEKFPKMPLMQTENECGDGKNTWDYSEYVFGLLRHYLTNGVEAFIYWNPILKPGGVSTWGWPQNALITINPSTKRVAYNPEYQVMRHFSHFVHPGAVRRGLKGEWAEHAVAFENPGGEAVVVVHNPSASGKTLRLEAGGKRLKVRLEGHSFNTIVF